MSYIVWYSETCYKEHSYIEFLLILNKYCTCHPISVLLRKFCRLSCILMIIL